MRKQFVVTFEYPDDGWAPLRSLDAVDVCDIIHDGSLEFGHFDGWTVQAEETP